MASSVKEFGLKLKQALETIKAQTGRSIADIKDDVGELIGYKAATLNQIQRGRLSIKLDKLERLTRVLVDPKRIDSNTLLVSTGFDRPWFEQFLKDGDYPPNSRKRLLEELFPSVNELTSPTVPYQPPVPLEFPPFVKIVGRKKELLALQKQLEVDHFVIVTGMPGIGKTALAGAFTRMLERPSERLFWYTLRGQDGLNSIIFRLANFLAHHGEPAFFNLLNQGRQPDNMFFDQILLTMSGKGYLLCIDDFHRLKDVEVINQVLTPLIQGTKRGDFDLLIASREMPPGIYPSDTMKSFTVEGLNEVATTELLSQLNQSPSEDIKSVLHQLTQGNPQFLILAATILNREQNLANLFKRIGEEVDIERFMMTEVDENLDDDEQDVMRSLSICMEYPATYSLIEEIADRGNLRKALSNLCHRHLLLIHKDSDTTRYSQHAIIQQFYYGQIRRRDRQAMHSRAAVYYSTEEQDIFKAALHYEKAGEFEQAIEYLIGDNTLSLIYQGHSLEASQLLNSLRAKVAADNNIQSRILQSLGTYYRLQGAYESAIQTLNAGFEQAISTSEQVQFLDEMTRMHRSQGAFDNALQMIEQIQEIHKHNPALLIEPKALNNMGWVYYRLGNVEKAEHYFTLAWSNSERDLDPIIIADTKQGLGTMAYRKGLLDVALQHFTESQKIFKETSDLIGQAQSLNNLGFIYQDQRKVDEALDNLEAALEIYERIGDINGYIIGAYNIAITYVIEGQYGAADSYLEEGYALAERLQNYPLLCRYAASRSKIALHQGRLEQAKAYLETAQKWLQKTATDAEQGIVHYVSGAIALAEENYEVALKFMEEALPLLEETYENDYIAFAQLVKQQAINGLSK